MRAYLPDYELLAPRDLADALAILAANPGEWRPFAGGTDLMVLLDAGMLPHTRYVSLWGLPELTGIHVSDREVVLGAMVTYSEILAHPVLDAEFGLLCRAAAETGGVATQNRGTIGGNIANASPAADTPPALLVYDAELELASLAGTRRVPYDGFHTGYKQMTLEPGEIIMSVRLPRRAAGSPPAGAEAAGGRSGGTWIERYRKVGTRRAQAISKVCFAAAARVGGGVIEDARIALGSVAPTVVRCAHAERALIGVPPGTGTAARAVEALARDIAPIDDMRSSAAYRNRVAGNLLFDFVRAL